MQLNVDAPYLLKKVIGIDFLLFRQKNTLDKVNRTLRIDAWNESFCTRVEIQELCIYSVHPENPEWTCFEQSADLDIKSFFGFEGKILKMNISELMINYFKYSFCINPHFKLILTYLINLGTAEKLAIKEYSASIGKSKDIMEHYIKILAEQGITHIEIFLLPSDATNESSEGRPNVEDASRSPQTSKNPLKDKSTNVEDKEGGKYKVKLVKNYF